MNAMLTHFDPALAWLEEMLPALKMPLTSDAWLGGMDQMIITKNVAGPRLLMYLSCLIIQESDMSCT